MAEVLPFVGLRYNSQTIGNLGKILSPPFDEITPALQSELHARHEFNAVRLELGYEKDTEDEDAVTDRYTRAATLLRAWCSDGVLVEDQAPALYVVDQEFSLEGRKARRRGVLAVVKLSDVQVRGHEHTFEGPKADRLRLLRATKANISPIFAIFEDPGDRAMAALEEHAKGKAWESATDHNGIVHKMWVLQKRDAIMSFRDAIRDIPLTIADGHHRYETALAYRDEMRRKTGKADGNQPFDYVMMYLTSTTQAGLAIRPIHRLLTRELMAEVDLPQAIEDLSDNFDIEDFKLDLEKPAAVAEVERRLAEVRKGRFIFVLPSGKAHQLDLREEESALDLVDDAEMDPMIKSLDVSLLHHYIISHAMVGNPEYELEPEECKYQADLGELLAQLRTSKGALAVMMNPPELSDVIAIAGNGLRMPRRSTHFHPKPACGLVIRSMESDERLKGKK